VFAEALPFTLGLEEELMLVEPGSLAVAPVNVRARSSRATARWLPTAILISTDART
jgi:hypothetical protein